MCDSVDCDDADNDGGIGHQPVAPESIAQHHHGLSTSRLLWKKRTAEARLHAEHAKEVAGDPRDGHVDRINAIGAGDASGRRESNHGPNAGRCRGVPDGGIPHRAWYVVLFLADPDPDELVR